MITFLRSILFGFFFYGGTILIGFSFLPLTLLPERVGRPFFNFWIDYALWSIRVFAGIKPKIVFHGTEGFPTTPAIYASKHQSAWETIYFKRLMSNAVFVLKKELKSVPFFGWYLTKMRQIAVDRAAGASAMRGMIQQAQDVVADGYSIIIYPQGTRVAPGDDVPYHPGVFALYRSLGLPVVPIALNSGRLWPRNGLFKHAGIVTVSVLPTIEPGLNRKEFMEKLESVIEAETLRLNE